MTETIEISRTSLKQILEMHIDATELLEQTPQMMDQGRLSEASQHIGAELEARIAEMKEAEKRDRIIQKILEEIRNDEAQESESLSSLEDEILD